MNVTESRQIEIVEEKATCHYVKLSIFVHRIAKYCIYGLLQERRLFQSMKRRYGLGEGLSQTTADWIEVV